MTPTNLSPYCLQQLRDADIRIPDTARIIGGAKLTYSGLQTSIAKKIMASLQTNHAKALAIITEAQALASPSLDQEDCDDLLNDLLDTNTVISSKLHEKLLAASMLQSGEQLPPGKLTKALALNWN